MINQKSTILVYFFYGLYIMDMLRLVGNSFAEGFFQMYGIKIEGEKVDIGLPMSELQYNCTRSTE